MLAASTQPSVTYIDLNQCEKDFRCPMRANTESLQAELAMEQLGRLNLTSKNDNTTAVDWQPISLAPFDRNLELAVINSQGTHALVFPCRRILGGWLKSETNERVDVRPTHWREWVATP